MQIRHLVRENRLSDPNLVTAKDCAEFIDRSEMWVWEDEGVVRVGFRPRGLRPFDPRPSPNFFANFNAALFFLNSRRFQLSGWTFIPSLH
jgi:hypothetical protein